MKIVEGYLTVQQAKMAIVVSRFNLFIGSKILEGAIDTLKRHGVPEENVEVYYVPGAFEIPLVAKKIAAKEHVDGVICLGAIIRGETPHFDYVAAEVAKGIASVSIKTELPITFGVITADNLEQAIERAGCKGGNKGEEAALAVLEMVDLLKQIERA